MSSDSPPLPLLLLLLLSDEAKYRALLPRLSPACTGSTLALTPTCAPAQSRCTCCCGADKATEEVVIDADATDADATDDKCEKRRRREPPPCRSASIDGKDNDDDDEARERRPMAAARSRTAWEVVMARV